MQGQYRAALLVSGLALLCLGGCENALPEGSCPFTGADGGACTPQPVTRVSRENVRRGDADWWVPYPQWAANHEIEGYTDRLSYNAGETVQVSLSSAKPGTSKWRLYRMGWYLGHGARLIDHGEVATTPQPLPPASTWDVPCDPKWPVTFTVALAPDLVSGIYALRFDGDGKTSYQTFTVREDDRVADIVYQRSDFTDAMYNNWDGDTNHSSWYGAHPQYVSLRRVQRTPSGSLYPYSGGFFSYEVSLVRFLERQGYDVTYVSNIDVHTNEHALDRGRIFLSAGHDEYWTKEMRDHVENARDAGKHLALFSSDTCDGILRFNPDDPTQISVTQVGATATTYVRETWGDLPQKPGGAPHDNPTDTLTGMHYVGWCGVFDNACDFNGFEKLRTTYEPTIEVPVHPVFRSLPPHVKLGNIMGYEFEAHDPGFASPAHVQQIADVPSIVEFMLPPAMVAYQADSGAKVFNAGSMHFAHGLDHWAGWAVFRNDGGIRACASGDSDCFDVESLAVQQLTINVLSDMGAVRHSPRGPFVDGIECDWNAPSSDCRGTASPPPAQH